MLPPLTRSEHRRATHAFSGVLAIVLVSVLAGCTTVETQGFEEPADSNVEYAQISTDADFGHYDRLLPQEMGIFFPRDVSVPPEDLARIRQIFRTAFIAELADYNIESAPGPTTMTVQASLIDMRQAGATGGSYLKREIQELATPGKIVFLMEMRDSQSNRVLARGADSAITPVVATAGGVETDWQSVEDAAGRWASLFRQFLDQNLGR